MHPILKDPADVIFNTTVLTVEHLIEKLDVKVTKMTIRNELFDCASYPVIPLDYLCKMLEGWGISSIVLKANIEILKSVNLPAIAYLPGNLEGLGVFIVVVGISDDFVSYYLAGSGVQTESLKEFEERWTEGVLVPLEVSLNQSGEELYLENKEIENSLKNIYKGSVRIIDNFISNEDCDFIIDYCDSNELFARSKVDIANGQDDIVHPVRTSYSALIEDRNISALNNLYSKVSQFTGSLVNNIENIQCVRYGPGEQFGVHFDSDITNRRLYTLLIYLNDNYQAGETYFPEIDLKITPKKGRCLMFRNVDESYNKILHSVHSGLPTTSGVKYACNIWVRYPKP
ncbi:hypothetical protein SanaruYs_31130 [Chryseotalea sanaruensis]|uniref:Fe2OG dioxygenase domain-containing protein n=1 Tax=Chryseotalea sanaruensis TaxID=2482724 RepID=A0A401UDB8_9BACT|nr:2OG-Fe(II) oxygenase [Chryseotalea sanaruensis]GCC52874.1 hypothetical protein SanaruYs_31130 [Chryseotalea sanaruensis]